MKVIVGLGNPGGQYAETRHNVGFMLADSVAVALKADFRPKYQGLFAEISLDKERIYLLKPQTYMNLSGRALLDLVRFYKISAEDVLVIHDDMDLPLGKIRLRNQGSPGGHNGIRSIIGELGTEKFWRLKIGVGRPPEHWDPAHYVLSPFSGDEVPVLKEVLERSEKALRLWAEGESEKAMNLYNR